MVAAYFRGYTVRITASGSLRAKGRMARTPTTTSNTRIPRLRRACDLPYLRLLWPVIVGSPPPQDHASEFVRLLSKSIQVSVILYRQVGSPGLLLARELQRLLVQTPLRSPRTTPLFRHRDGHGDVEVPAPARLEQQRYLDHEELRHRSLDTPVGLATHQRMQYLFQIPQCPGVTEYLAAEGFAVDTVRSSDTFPEAFDNPGYRPAIVLQEVVHDLIGRGRLRAWQVTQEADQRTLARRKRTGDGYGHRSFHGPSL